MAGEAASRGVGRNAGLVWLLIGLFALATVAVLALASNISTRKAEALQVVFPIVNLDETVVDPEEWGKNFPRQYDSYKRTVDIQRTRYGGSEAFQRLDEDPRLRTIFNGYAFAIDYREERGHAYMLSDQRETERVTKKPQPGACLHCHASMLNVWREQGIKAGAPGQLTEPASSEHGMAQIFAGWEAINPQPYSEATKLAEHPVACIDCHDPRTMALRVTRPGFMEGVRVLAKSDEPVPHLPSVERWRRSGRSREYDPNIDASRQEMRSLVCAQCHVEYSFQGKEQRLTYPWHNGLKVEQIEAWYDQQGFSDWKHADSGAGVLKAQHPEFEMWSQGIHARSGVACADCHMPYKREGAIKVSDHHIRSPVLNVAAACQTCHHYDENELVARVETIQGRTKALLDRAEDATVDLINAIKAAAAGGASDEQLKAARALQRRAQFRTDFVNAENSMGFHASQEVARVLGEAIDYARQGQVEVAKLGVTPAGGEPTAQRPAQERPEN